VVSAGLFILALLMMLEVKKTYKTFRREIIDNMLIGAFCLGVVGLVKTLLLEVSSFSMCIMAVLLSPVIEELTKGIIIYCCVIKSRSSPSLKFLSGYSVGLGFACAENISYGILYASICGFYSGFEVMLLRLTFLPIGHTLFSGLFVVLALKKKPYLGLAAGILLHSLWNGLVLLGGSSLGIVIIYIAYGLLFYLLLRSIKNEEISCSW